MSGFIKLHRGWRNTDGLRKPAKFSEPEAWLWMLENASWKSTNRFDHQGQTIPVNRGELHTSERSLASSWGWSRKAVVTFLNRLETVQKVSRKRGHSGSHLTICNYDKYQNNGASEGAAKEPRGSQEGATQEEGKEGKEEKENTHYAFFGRIIRLTENDLERWRNRYSNIHDLDAQLGSLDDWLVGQNEETRKKWFHIASGALNKKHQEGAAADDDDEGLGVFV